MTRRICIGLLVAVCVVLGVLFLDFVAQIPPFHLTD